MFCNTGYFLLNMLYSGSGNSYVLGAFYKFICCLAWKRFLSCWKKHIHMHDNDNILFQFWSLIFFFFKSRSSQRCTVSQKHRNNHKIQRNDPRDLMAVMMESDIITCTCAIYRWVDAGTATCGERNLCLLQRSNPSHGGKEGKPHEPHFELEATSFPPLPGSTVSTWACVVGFTTWMVVLWLQHVLLGWLPEEWSYYGWGVNLKGMEGLGWAVFFILIIFEGKVSINHFLWNCARCTNVCSSFE